MSEFPPSPDAMPPPSAPDFSPSDPSASSRRWDWRPKMRWFAAEYFIVVLGVLTAVALSRWNEGLQDREHERQYLIELLQDLEADQEELSFNRDMGMRRAMQIREVMETVGTADDLFDHTVQVEWPSVEAREGCRSMPLICIINIRVFDGSRAVYQELTQSGQLRVIRDRELVSALTRYYALVDSRQEAHLNVMRPKQRQLAEAMHGVGLTGWSDEPDHFERFVSSVRRSPELQSRLREAYVESHHQVFDIDTNHQPMLDEVLRLVREQVGTEGLP